jgi:hypothetical protein
VAHFLAATDSMTLDMRVRVASTRLGDAMRDPEMVFEVDAAGTFHSVSFQQDNLGLYHEAIFVDDAGRVMTRPRVAKDLATFARQWDRNLKDQGFVDAARAEARKRAAAG